MYFSDSEDEDLEVVIDGDQDPPVLGAEVNQSRYDQEDDNSADVEQENRRQARDAAGEDDQEMDVSDGQVRDNDQAGDADVGEVEVDDGELNNNGLSMPKRKRKEPAPVWKKCATRLEDGKGKCNFCSRIFACTEGSTSTLVAHIRTSHSKKDAVKELIVDINKKKEETLAKMKKRKMETSIQPSILSFAGRRGVIDPAKKRKLDDAIVKMTVGMDRPFDDVENYYFRQLLFIADPNYICPSRRRHTSNFDQAAIKVEEELKKDIVKDIIQAGHKTVSITSDHGTSSDISRTKKNALTLARTTKNFVIKKDTITLIECEGSQTGAKIREDVKKALIHGAGWKEDWTVNWVTDNESKQVNARDPTKHAQIGMKTNYTGGCVDHTTEEVALAREAFKKIMVDARFDPFINYTRNE